MFPAGKQQHACGGTGGGEACPPGPRSKTGTPLSQESTCWDCLLGSEKREGGVGNQEKVRIHIQEAWLNESMGAATEEQNKDYWMCFTTTPDDLFIISFAFINSSCKCKFRKTIIYFKCINLLLDYTLKRKCTKIIEREVKSYVLKRWVPPQYSIWTHLLTCKKKCSNLHLISQNHTINCTGTST